MHVGVTLSSKSIKDPAYNKPIHQRLKRERPIELHTPKVTSVSYDNVKQSTSSLDIKKPRVSSGCTVPSNDAFALKLSNRHPVTVLEECLRSEEIGDKQGTWNGLREFSSEHLNVLDCMHHCECARLLLKIAKKSKFVLTTNICLRYLLCLMQNSTQKQSVWPQIASLIGDEERKELDLCNRSATYSSLLSLFEFALCEELLLGIPLQRVRFVAEQSIHSSDQNNRVAAINFFVTLLVKTQQCTSKEYIWLERLLANMTEDRDSRVRIASVKGLAAMAKSVRSLSFYMYPLIKKICGNSSKIVRIEALNILKVLADRRPEVEVTARNGAKLRLVDDAFATVCHAINDIEVTVRAVAARILGDFHAVSDLFLDQTLDKKLLNAMRISKTRDNMPRRVTQHSSRHQSEASTEWSTGRKLGEDVPAEKFDDEQTAIIPSGACGAFVTALEDEFMIVRQAGVYSLGRLAADRPFLAAAALDHLADMFNDEIEQVRLDSVRALTPLVLHGVLQKEQLDTILTVLDDALPDSREALRVLLMQSTLGTPDCLQCTVKALLKCMMRFPIDRSSIFKCMSKLGRTHATFVQLLCDELLDLHPVFDITEPALDDHFYLAKLILLLNAASKHEPICSLLPDFVVRHYKFLRCSMPDLVPAIPALAEEYSRESELVLNDHKNMSVSEHTRSLLAHTYEMMQEASLAKSYHQRMVEHKLLLRDMDALCRADREVADTAQFLSNLLQILSHCDISVQILSHGGDLHSALGIIEQGITSIDRVESSFSSIDQQMLATLEEFRFQLSILRFAALFDMELGTHTDVAEIIRSEVESFKQRLQKLGVSASTSILDILVNIESCIDVAETKKFFCGSSLLALFKSHTITLPMEFASLGMVRIKWVQACNVFLLLLVRHLLNLENIQPNPQIVEPLEAPTEPMRFVAGLPLGIPVNIVLHNFDASDVDRFRIQIDYPNRSTSFFCPQKSEFKQIGAQTYRLLCKVLVQANNVWSDSARVTLNCVLKPTRSMSSCSSEQLGSSSTEYSPSQCIPLVESPFSTKQAAISILIQPILAKSSC